TRMLIWFERNCRDGVYIFENQDAVARGLGTPEVLAISRGLRNSPLAIFHVIGQAMANAGALDVEEILSGVDDAGWYEEHVGRPGRKGLEVYYALRAFFREHQTQRDFELRARVKGLMSNRDVIEFARNRLGTEADISVVLRGFHQRRGEARNRPGEERLLAGIVDARQRAMARQQQRFAGDRDRTEIFDELSAMEAELQGMSWEQTGMFYDRAAEKIDQMMGRYDRRVFAEEAVEFIFISDEITRFDLMLLAELLSETDLFVFAFDLTLTRIFESDNLVEFEEILEVVLNQTALILESRSNGDQVSRPFIEVLVRQALDRFVQKPFVSRAEAEAVVAPDSEAFGRLFEQAEGNQEIVYLKSFFMDTALSLFRSGSTRRRLRNIYQKGTFSRWVFQRLFEVARRFIDDPNGNMMHALRVEGDRRDRVFDYQFQDVMRLAAPKFLEKASDDDFDALFSDMFGVYLQEVLPRKAKINDEAATIMLEFALSIRTPEQGKKLAAALSKMMNAMADIVTRNLAMVRELELDIAQLEQRRSGPAGQIS
ncbi:MAG TPA: hypothetical protein VLJ10_01095, partial [Candidatus Bathyarchaeia archaeon]|nr:hypothetical protein [Candidatus Bathyarchaeia archaeon]